MAVDYCALNSKTIPDYFSLPWIDDVLDRLGQSSVFTKLDLDGGYHQVSLDPQDAHKTAFLSKCGLYEYSVLPLGLTNAPATIKQLMNYILRLQLNKRVFLYLEDIIIYSKNIEDHLRLLEQILDRLEDHKIFV